ncbi:class I SAM-dependent methyltransferase family protein [Methanococcoides methylutens]|uniref:tRNA (Guanine(37)-N1)-methyltransferase Trm5b n=1 Tax=Methanococcoides methylutens MM1 TaxID=1434104 RepID=A0A0E3SQF3_METMT|nr:class I SAM-dependent methyltransferase family protein [Methanococcoides methylutens]AKB84217.1 tRNA (guanine(37)-N1)-methyltransferase Trm5b [Methanococcoides methylutens MM1]
MKFFKCPEGIPEDLCHLVPKRFDAIGDVAVVSIPSELEGYKIPVAEYISSKRGNIRAVLNKVTKLEGDHRVAGFELLLGDSSITTHVEFGFRYRMDLKDVFFNGRLAFERERVASMVREGEDVLVPFCGVGPFAIPAASKGAKVIALEKNPAACKWLAENIRLNHVEDNIDPILADASFIGNLLNSKFDRVIIPTPYGMDNFLECVLPFVKHGGNLHFYTFKTREDFEGVIDHCSEMGLEVTGYRRCGNVAPGISRWVLDMLKL